MARTFGERLRSARMNVGMTQAELAAKLGLTYQSVSQWERCDHSPRVDTVMRIADALGVSADFLLDVGGVEMELPDWLRSRDTQKPAAIVEWTQEAEERISAALEKLNTTGQNVAVERVEELTKIPDYQK